MGVMYTVMNVLHVVTAVFLVGPMAVIPMAGMRHIRAGQGAAVLSSARSTTIFSVGSVVVAIFGFGLIGLSSWDPKPSVADPWILISLILYAVALALSLIAVVPALRTAGERLQEGAGAGVATREYKRIAMASGVVTLLLVAVTVLMVVRP